MKLTPMEVSYSQVAAFQSALANPFNDWTDAHVAQGFAWRSGSVSFATIDQAGPIEIEVTCTRPDTATSPAARIIEVPFDVDVSGEVEVATIGDSQPIRLRPGRYRLCFEHGVTEVGAMWLRLSFEPVSLDERVEPRVVRADGLNPPDSLLMTSAPAVP